MLTPLCLSQVEDDGRGVKGVSGKRETGALKEHNVVISSFPELSRVVTPFCSRPVLLYLEEALVEERINACTKSWDLNPTIPIKGTWFFFP